MSSLPATEPSLKELENSQKTSQDSLQDEPAEKLSQQPTNYYLIGLKILIYLFLFNIGIETLRFVFSSFSCTSDRGIYQGQGRSYLYSINKGQQAYLAETGKFSNSIEDLGLGINAQTRLFNYTTRATDTSAFSYAIGRQDVQRIVTFGLTSWQKKVELKSYVSGVFLVPSPHPNNGEPADLEVRSILCETELPVSEKPADPFLKNGVPTCAPGTLSVTR